MQSFSRVTSGLISAQTGLYTTGHNISNASTDGYTRQRANFADDAYGYAGYNAFGPMKVGLGSKLVSITQLRNEFLDKTYRNASSKASFYNVKGDAITEIENILGELYGDSRLSKCIDDLWSSIQELSTHPEGMETRSMFITSAKAFLTKTNEIANGLYEYQLTINNEIIKSVNRINEITTQIHDLNGRIALNEASGDNANDYRDVRNNLLDELALYGDMEYKENSEGQVIVLMEGKDLITKSGPHLLGLKYTAPGQPFVEPIFNPHYVKDGRILNYNETARPLYTNLQSAKIGSRFDNDYGSLKAMLLTRGEYPANYTTPAEKVANYSIPKFQRELDILFNKVVTLINDMLAPQDHDASTAPKDASGKQFTELFKRKYTDRYDTTTGDYIEEDDDPPRTLYSMGNVIIHPDVFNNFNKLCLSASGDPADTTVIENILEAWKGDYGNYLPSLGANSTKLSFDAYYRQIVTNLGEEGSTAKIYVESQNKIVVDTIASRQQMSGVALDEELVEMMKFQHAYDAAAKMINVIDSMMESVISLKR